MKLLRKWGVVCLILMCSACKNDDDNIIGLPQGGLDTLTLLTTGIWYQEAKTPVAVSDCEKNTNIDFRLDTTMVLEMFDDAGGPCEFIGTEIGVFTITNNREVTISSENITVSFVIDLINTEFLVITTDEGETITFDRIQG